jgi:hypothetical protein
MPMDGNIASWLFIIKVSTSQIENVTASAIKYILVKLRIHSQPVTFNISIPKQSVT